MKNNFEIFSRIIILNLQIKGDIKRYFFMALSKSRKRQVKQNNFGIMLAQNVRKTPIWPKPKTEDSNKK